MLTLSGSFRRTLIALLLSFVLVAAIQGCARQPEPRQGRAVSLIVTNATVITMDPQRRVIQDGAVAVDGADIVAVGTAPDIGRRFHSADTIDAAGQVVMPGLINTHGHVPMVLYRGLADDLPLEQWLQNYIFPAEAKTVSPDFVRDGTRLGALEMIQSGTTTFADMYYFEEDIARETKVAGLRAVLGQTVIQFPVADAATPQAGLERARAFIAMFQGDPLITPAVAPHAPYTLDAASLKAARALAIEHQVPMLIHVAETRDEASTSQKERKASPVGYLQSLGVLGPGVLAAHGVWVSDADIAILKQTGVAVSHNPESNMKLASGIAPVPAYLRAGVPVGLGTDGAASNNDLDMFEAMRIASFLDKVHTLDPSVASAQTVLEMATLGGAATLGMSTSIGSLEPGKRADLIVVDLRAARQTPVYDPVSQIVYTTRGDDVRTTIVHGKVLMRDRKVLTLDEAKVLATARAWAPKVRAAVKR